MLYYLTNSTTLAKPPTHRAKRSGICLVPYWATHHCPNARLQIGFGLHLSRKRTIHLRSRLAQISLHSELFITHLHRTGGDNCTIQRWIRGKKCGSFFRAKDTTASFHAKEGILIVPRKRLDHQATDL